MEAGYEWWKCDLPFPTSLCLNWFFFLRGRERNERCCTASHHTEQLTSITAGWWHWPHHTRGKIRSLPWVLMSREPPPWSRAGIRRFPAEDFWGLVSAFKLSLRYVNNEIDASHFHKASAGSKLCLAFGLCACVSEVCHFLGCWAASRCFILYSAATLGSGAAKWRNLLSF